MVLGRHLLPGKPHLLSLLSFFLLTSSALGASTNITVDDQKGDAKTGAVPSFTPASSWNLGPQCTGCFVQPSTSQAFDGTWHDATDAPGEQTPTITYSFTGTAVYAYLILANQVQFATTFSNLSFILDGNLEGTFVHNPDSTTDFVYNVNGFSKTGLTNSQHTIEIQNNVGKNNSLILFDYLIYTAEDTVTTSSTSSSSSTTGTSSSSTSSTTSASSSTSTGSSSNSPQGPVQSGSVTSGSGNTTTTTILGAMGSQTSNSGSNTVASGSNQEQNSAAPSETSASTQSANKLGAIIGGTAAGAVAVVIALFLLLCKRCRRYRRESFGSNIQPFAPAAATSQPQANARSLPPPPGSLEAGRWAHQDFLTLSPSASSTAVATLRNAGTEGGQMVDIRSDHDSLIARASNTRPPTYAAPARRIALASKWSDDSPLTTSSSNPLSSNTMTSPVSTGLTSRMATGDLSSRATETWEPSAPSEYNDEPPPRYI